MTWAGVAIAGAAVVGGALSSQGAQSAAQDQANAAMNAQNISQNEFNTITGQEQPFMQAGYGALTDLNYLLGVPGNYGTPGATSPNQRFSGPGMGPAADLSMRGPNGQMLYHQMGSFGAQGAPGNYSSPGGAFGSLLQPFTTQNWQQLSPAYGFQLEQGKQGVLGGDASSMGALSGAAQKDLMGYNQNLANTSFNNAFNMYQTQQGNIYQRLAGMVQMGQAAAANTGQQGTALAGQAAQSATNIGTAQAGGAVGSANAWSNALTSASYMPWLMGSSAGANWGGTPSSAGFTGAPYG